MDEKRALRSLKRIFLVVFVLLVPLFAVAQSGDEVTDLLVKMGFENVSWAENESERVYVLENTAYRLSGVGIGKALDEIQKYGMPGAGKQCRLIVLDNNVPQISLCCDASAEDGKELSRNDWNVSYDLGESWEMVKGEKRKNSSLYKVDVLVYPEFSFKNYKLSVPYEVLVNLNPTVKVSLWKGGSAMAQLVLPVVNQYGYEYGAVRPGYIMLAHTMRLPYNIFLTGSVGLYNWNRAGADLRLRYFLNNGKIWFDGRASYTLEGTWGEWQIHKGEWEHVDPFKFVYDKSQAEFTGHLGANFYWQKLETQLGFRFEKYLYGYTGFRADMIRHFKYCSIGFYIKRVGDVWWNDGWTGGFQFQITIPPYKYKRKGYVPRVMPAGNWGLSYNAAGTLGSGIMFSASPDESISSEVKFNPNYIKTELLNF